MFGELTVVGVRSSIARMRERLPTEPDSTRPLPSPELGGSSSISAVCTERERANVTARKQGLGKGGAEIVRSWWPTRLFAVDRWRRIGSA